MTPTLPDRRQPRPVEQQLTKRQGARCSRRACADCGVITTTSARCMACFRKWQAVRNATTPPDRLWSRVDRTGECWLWTGHRTRWGYGEVHFQGRLHRTHRLAWELTNGPIPAGLFVLHRCDNPPCVRPSHLFLGTPADNMRDMVAKGRSLVGARQPAAKLTVDQVRAIRSSDESAPALARRFGVSRSTVRDVRSGSRWAGVA